MVDGERICKILNKSKIRNRDLLRRSDLDDLQKTAIHRYNYDSEKVFAHWFFLLLTQEEQTQIAKQILFSTEMLLSMINRYGIVVFKK